MSAGPSCSRCWWAAARWILPGSVALTIVAAYLRLRSVHPSIGFVEAASSLMDRGLWYTAMPVALLVRAAVAGFSCDAAVLAALRGLFAVPCAVVPQVKPHAFYTANLMAAAVVALVWLNVWDRKIAPLARLFLRRVPVVGAIAGPTASPRSPGPPC